MTRTSIRVPVGTHKRRPKGWMLLARALTALATVTILLGTMYLVSLARDLPDTSSLAAAPTGTAMTFLDRHGRVIARRGDSSGTTISADALPHHLVDAVLAVEDRRFYHHFGIDLIGTTRAALANLRAGRVVQGGSTITQQLAKNLFLTPDRTFRRKAQEMMLAFWLETRFTKDEILALYLNRVYFGAGAWGAENASRRYFGRGPHELDIGEAALLAGLLKAPSRYSPANDTTRAAVRATVVLDLMLATGRITEEERLAAASAPIRVSRGSSSPGAGWFADFAASEARTLLALHAPAWEGDVVVRTTLDIEVQRAADSALTRGLADPDIARGAANGAIIALDAAGAVAAMSGGTDYARSPFNRAVSARRQPGSAFKPFIYASAFEAGWSPADHMMDEPVSYGSWSPANWENRYEGEMTLERAFARSSNSIAVQLAEATGRAYTLRLARRMGIESPMENTHSLSLGAYEVTPLELARAYVPFMNGGRAVETHAVIRLETPSGEVLWTRETGPGPIVLADRVVREMDQLFAATVRYGTGRSAAVQGREVRGKTGTTNGFRDAWFAGWADGLVTVVWTGNDSNAPTDAGSGGTGPARIFASMVAAAPVIALPDDMPATPATDPDRLARLLSALEDENLVSTAYEEPPPPAPPASEPAEDPIAGLLARLPRD
ncbi:transglycosylase domain-containing protein [Glycocaulis sp.]|uniref:transglycosylase domain-containing protein n=1 Tax=Glycocaulis sp. TaxID=1969725 RepID=UPI003D1FBCE3